MNIAWSKWSASFEMREHAMVMAMDAMDSWENGGARLTVEIASFCAREIL